MSNDFNFTRVPRPSSNGSMGRRRSAMTTAIIDTLTTGDAVTIPLNGKLLIEVRNRATSSVSRFASAHHAHVRTARSDDGLSLLIWLEPKPATAEVEALQAIVQPDVPVHLLDAAGALERIKMARAVRAKVDDR